MIRGARTIIKYAYLHGFGSTPNTFKGNELAKVLANYKNPEFIGKQNPLDLHRPDLNKPDFTNMTISNSLSVMDELHYSNTLDTATIKWRLIGSSYGGYIAARWASENPDKVEKLLLLSPVFDPVLRLTEILGQDRLQVWRQNFTIDFPIDKTTSKPLSYAFFEDAMRHPAYPMVDCPTRIIHGSQDRLVPIESSRSWVMGMLNRQHQQATMAGFVGESSAFQSDDLDVKLITVDDEHSLAQSMPQISEEVKSSLLLNSSARYSVQQC